MTRFLTRLKSVFRKQPVPERYAISYALKPEHEEHFFSQVEWHTASELSLYESKYRTIPTNGIMKNFCLMKSTALGDETIQLKGEVLVTAGDLLEINWYSGEVKVWKPTEKTLKRIACAH